MSVLGTQNCYAPTITRKADDLSFTIVKNALFILATKNKPVNAFGTCTLPFVLQHMNVASRHSSTKGSYRIQTVNLQMLFGVINALEKCNWEASGDSEHWFSDLFYLPVEMNRENQHSDCWIVQSFSFLPENLELQWWCDIWKLFCY